jgi:hypothetical protein
VLTVDVSEMSWWLMHYDGDNLVITENDLGLSKSSIPKFPFQHDVKKSL